MTKLSKTLGKGFSHDIFRRMLSKEIDVEFELLKKVRPVLKTVDIDNIGMIVIDDTVIKKTTFKGE